MKQSSLRTLRRKYQATGNERVGFIHKTRGVLELTNIAREADKGFEIDPLDLIKHEDHITHIWHTHPGAEAEPSDQDLEGFKAYPDLFHIIVGSDGTKQYRVTDAGLIVEHA